MAVHIALSIAADGSRDVLGMWAAENEGTIFWVMVFNALKARGQEEVYGSSVKRDASVRRHVR